MNDAFAKDNNENSLHSFLFLSRLNLTRQLMPYFRPCCHLVNRLRWVSAMSFIYRQTMNTTLYYWSQALFLSVMMTNDSIYLHRLRHRSGMVDSYGATYNVPARPEHFLLAETVCTGRFVRLPDFIKIADECDLWHDVARCLAYRLMVMSARDRELVGVDSYLKVRALLTEIWAYPQAYRESIIVLNFIQRRTGISRSRTMKILSELKKAGISILIMGG